MKTNTWRLTISTESNVYFQRQGSPLAKNTKTLEQYNPQFFFSPPHPQNGNIDIYDSIKGLGKITHM